MSDRAETAAEVPPQKGAESSANLEKFVQDMLPSSGFT